MRDCAFHYRSSFCVFGEILAVLRRVLVCGTPTSLTSSNFRSDKASTMPRAAKVDVAVEEQLTSGLCESS